VRSAPMCPPLTGRWPPGPWPPHRWPHHRAPADGQAHAGCRNGSGTRQRMDLVNTLGVVWRGEH
jgi:hypothetical protein